jgi:hypothetical protein
MMFFFKEKPVEIIAFCNPTFSAIAEYSPIKPSNKFYPQWWKDLNSSTFNWDTFQVNNTTKSCPGISNIFQSGFIMPLWSDLALEYGNGEWKYSFSDKFSSLIVHDNQHMRGFYEEHSIFKLTSPWIIQSSVNLLQTEPFYHHSYSGDWPFITPYGITPPVSSKNMHMTNIFLLAKKEQEVKRIMIKNNTPLLHIIPLTDKKINFKIEVPGIQEYIRLSSLPSYSNHFCNRGKKNVNYTNTYLKN